MALTGISGGLLHGGDLGAARSLFPNAPQPLIDLSTGINPYSYPVPKLSERVFTRLPEPAATQALRVAAAHRYEAASAGHVAAAPGTQILLPRVAGLIRPGRAAVLGPTYNEHAIAAARAGHSVAEATSLDKLFAADLAIVVNPNNPDGRLCDPSELHELAAEKQRRGGLLVVDEAFMDVMPGEASVAPLASEALVVLRSFGKFYGLAGLRLGFAIAAPALAERLSADLGPWAVSGPALAAALVALPDNAWAEAMRLRLERAAERLRKTLRRGGFDLLGGTSLFQLAREVPGSDMFHRLGSAGILVRRFPERPGLLRFGLPASEPAWRRLGRALGSASAGS